MPTIAKRNVSFVIDAITSIIRSSNSYRNAEANFAIILPYLRKASEKQIVRLLNAAAENSEVHDEIYACKISAAAATKSWTPTHAETLAFLTKRLARYA